VENLKIKMNNLFILNEILTNKYNIGFLDLLSVFTVICGIYTIISKNPIISILFLIGLFGGISSYLILIGLSFIGLSYLIIYIGAVSILFLFILMLINIRISELHNYNKNSIPLALIITILLSSSIFPILPYNIEVKKDLFINNDLYFSSSND
jgi:NADH-ubiquinone oxidoreductase chain 6